MHTRSQQWSDLTHHSHHSRSARLLVGLTLALSAMLLVACGGGGDSPAVAPAAVTVQLKGVAATGAAIAHASVKAVNAKGVAATGVTGADGSFTVTINDAAPYVLSVNDGAGKQWVSYAPTAGTVNITPLTTLALLDANAGKPLADLVNGWGTTQLTQAAVAAAARKVNANFRAQIQGQGLNANTLNIFNQPFTANHTGLDAVLDNIRVSLNCSATACSQSITQPNGQALISWNANISTTGIDISWTAAVGGGGTGGTVNVSLGACAANPPAGSYSLVVQTTVTGLGSLPIPEICINGLPGKPSSQSEFCADAGYQQQLPAGVSIVSCSYVDPTGTISARITSPITLDYSVRYTFVKR